jgi:hypothetical protein
MRLRIGSGLLCLLSAGLLVAAVGCGPPRRPRVPAPPVDPEGISRAVLQLADADGDGLVTAAELVSLPGLVPVITAWDADGDKRLSAAELTAWLTGISNARIALLSSSMVVTCRGKPVEGAAVKLVPEPFMGSGMQAAEGTTDASGMAMPSIAGGRYPGVNCGVYRVEITGSLPDGRPIPAKYNSSTSLGLAVGNGLPAESPVEFRLD